MNVLKVVLMVNMTVATKVVLMVNVFMVHGHVMAWKIAITVQTKLIVNLKVVQMANLNVLMAAVSMLHGHATAMVTVLMAQTKLIAVK